MQSKLNTGAILSDGLTQEKMTDGRDDPVNSCLFRIVDLILHISKCAPLKILSCAPSLKF